MVTFLVVPVAAIVVSEISTIGNTSFTGSVLVLIDVNAVNLCIGHMFLKLYYSKPSFETATVSSNIVSPAAASVKINEAVPLEAGTKKALHNDNAKLSVILLFMFYRYMQSPRQTSA